MVALDAAMKGGATYADVRMVEIVRERILVRKGKVRYISSDESKGLGVRAIADGAWGFSSSYRVDRGEVKGTAEMAVKIARASAKVKKKDVGLVPAQVTRDKYRTPFKVDPFEVPLDRKLELLLGCDKTMREQSDLIKVSTGQMVSHKENKAFASSEGSYIEQNTLWCGAGISATAVGNGEVQIRSYPGSFGGDFSSRGYEFVDELRLDEHAEECGKEAVALLGAKSCPSGVKDVIIGGNQLALQIHESCGHPSELDRVLGTEASYAGTSFLTTDKLGDFRYGSGAVTLIADATSGGGLGTFAYDDEGVPAQRAELVKEGNFVGYLTDRQYAAEVGLPSSMGASRASGWNRIPIVRMTNINLEPGDWGFDELVSDTRSGIFVDINRSWSIDDRRLNFQFGTEVAREINGGELGALLKNAIYSAITPEFWGSCDAICGPKLWHMWGVPNCGKGEPGQVMYVGHGCAPSRFRNVRVGVGK